MNLPCWYAYATELCCGIDEKPLELHDPSDEECEWHMGYDEAAMTPRHCNPHEEGTSLWRAWDDGWVAGNAAWY